MQIFTFSTSLYLATSSGHGLLWYWEQCDIAAKFVVGAVLCCSIWSISAIIQKIFDLKSMRTKNFEFERQLRHSGKISDLKIARGQNNSPYEQLAAEALASYRRQRDKIDSESDVKICMGHVANAIQRGIGRVMVRYEKSMVLLSSFVSGGPFLGLLGTVWGVMVTFGSLTEKASIAQLAPGVSGALVATLSGLCLAIPAVFAYNAMLTRTKLMTTELENFASALADQIEFEILEQLRADEQASPALPSKPTPVAPARSPEQSLRDNPIRLEPLERQDTVTFPPDEDETNAPARNTADTPSIQNPYA